MLIGIAGPAGSGKDTTADFLVKNHGFVKVAFADVLKRACREFFAFSDEQLWGPSERRNEPDLRYHRGQGFGQNEFGDQVASPYLTPRHALQQLGTEFGRACYPNVWVDYALRIAKHLLETETLMYTANEGLVSRIEQTSMGEWHRDDEPAPGLPAGVVISDVRFLNEIHAIREAGGKVIRINRATSLSGVALQHRSEQEQLGVEDSAFDFILDNTGSLEQLEKTASTALAFLMPRLA